MIAVVTGVHIDPELLFSADLLLVPGILTADITETQNAPLRLGGVIAARYSLGDGAGDGSARIAHICAGGGHAPAIGTAAQLSTRTSCGTPS